MKTNHNTLTYAEAYVLLEELDADPNNSNNVLLLYTNRSQNATSTKCNVTNNGDCWNREHTWPKSLGVGYISTKSAYTDLHNLRASDSSVNSSRSNKIFGNVKDIGGSENNEAKGNYSNSTTWEPRDDIKGDIARISFYMATRYEGIDSETDLEFNTIGDVCTLLTWDTQDPVNQEEKKRNDLVYKYQKNRNPFVDNETYSQSIWGNQCN
ncbi:MAG: endonuclease I family protein [Halarcobacter sp.]